MTAPLHVPSTSGQEGSPASKEPPPPDEDEPLLVVPPLDDGWSGLGVLPPDDDPDASPAPFADEPPPPPLDGSSPSPGRTEGDDEGPAAGLLQPATKAMTSTATETAGRVVSMIFTRLPPEPHRKG